MKNKSRKIVYMFCRFMEEVPIVFRLQRSRTAKAYFPASEESFKIENWNCDDSRSYTYSNTRRRNSPIQPHENHTNTTLACGNCIHLWWAAVIAASICDFKLPSPAGCLPSWILLRAFLRIIADRNHHRSHAKNKPFFQLLMLDTCVVDW